MEIITARNVVAYSHQPNSLDMEVAFGQFPGQFIAFTAQKDDLAEHGRELYFRAIHGEFGPITELDAPAPSEDQQREQQSIKLQQAVVAMAPLEDAEKLGIASEEELSLLAAWRLYRVEVYRLPQSAGWPADVTWPEQPS